MKNKKREVFFLILCLIYTLDLFPVRIQNIYINGNKYEVIH